MCFEEGDELHLTNINTIGMGPTPKAIVMHGRISYLTIS